ncbi:MAG: leucyl/phenylalanyl-tRNA--protein transferase [Nevskiaceae bacterium]|jgi:leucyl/phenylalanyl-tRNA--protein transferase|nr:leucyl/phenylalanyl-tRNA--protein transferase [Nevskiaceae bacterium]
MKKLHWISADAPPEHFPDVALALDDPPGLLAGGGDLSVPRLLAAYRRGIFPWYLPGQPVLWWSPDPREVLLPAQFHASRSLLRRLRRGEFRITENQDFPAVVDGCAADRSGALGTWITPEMRAAYIDLARRGDAHSIEIWRDGELAGGLYGVRVGPVFCGESMFSRRDDASKAALAHLVGQCPARGITLIDCQLPSAHLRSLGSQAMPRREYLSHLAAQSSG